MERRNFIISCLAVVLWLALSVFPFSRAEALTQIRLFDIGYTDCPAEMSKGMVTSDGSGKSANCFMVTGKAENNSGKYVVDADVFGRIYDANGSPALQNRTRLGTILEVPPGISEFSIPITVASNQPEPLQLKQFKAAGFSSRVRPFYYDNDDI